MNIADFRHHEGWNGLASNSKFIVFEGTDGCGKSSTLRRVNRMINSHHIPTCYTREPGGTKLGEKIREEIINPNNHYTNDQLIHLFMQARQDHLNKVIRPAMKKHMLIICDRYVLSNMAYQGDYEKNPFYEETHEGLEYVDKNHILKQNMQLNNFVLPSLTVFLNTSSKTIQHRLRRRTQKQDKFDKALSDTKKLEHLRFQFKCGIEEMNRPFMNIDGDLLPMQRAKIVFKKIYNVITGK